jgi:hypothetical protein
MLTLPATLRRAARALALSGLMASGLALSPADSSAQSAWAVGSAAFVPGGLVSPIGEPAFQTVAEAGAGQWYSAVPPARQQVERVSPGRATLYSAVLPGAGQHLLDQPRKWAYVALEAAGWFFYFDRRSAGGELKAAYRDFAWEEARIQLGTRVDGDFDYYETLTKWGRSGAFDADPGSSGIQPEDDPSTFNGSIWSLATGLFLPDGPSTPPSDPQYERALEYYESRGYDTDFLWDWTGTGGAQDEYAGLISESDERYRQATNVVGAIIANHVVSSVDAYLSARGVPTPSEIRVAPGLGPSGSRWYADVRIGVGR